MIYTNKLNLPMPLFLALKGERYGSKSDISVTGLLKSPRIYQLEKRHDSQIVVDVSDLVWAVMGSALHKVIEKASQKDTAGLSEQYVRFPAKGPKREWQIGGVIDYLEEDSQGQLAITDWKFVSVWAYIFEKTKVKPEYVAQLNLYDWALHSIGLEAGAIRIGYVFRDWKRGDLEKAIANRKPYPEQIEIVPVEKWSRAEQREYIEKRIELHQKAEDLDDADLPLCTPEERWERGECWAVMKKGRKSALRLLPSSKEAQAFMKGDPALYVEHRLGRSMRCLAYCNARQFCDYAKGLKHG